MACRRNTLKWATRCCCSSFSPPTPLLPLFPTISHAHLFFCPGAALDSRYKYIAERCGIRSGTQRERDVSAIDIQRANLLHLSGSGPILEYAARIAPFFIFSMFSRSTFMSVFPPTCIKGTSKWAMSLI